MTTREKVNNEVSPFSLTVDCHEKHSRHSLVCHRDLVSAERY